jgi:enoyl-CoA hydratase/carnithine racemase
MSAELQAERQGDCLVLTISHPEARNTLTAAMCAAGLEALSTAQRDADIRAVVLAGAQGRFCGGLHQFDAIEGLNDWILALRDCAPLVVAAVDGEARGAGAALALACDLLVAAGDARLHLRDPLLPGLDVGGGQWLAGQMLPRPACNEALLLGLDGARLHGLGVVNRLCAGGSALPAALDLVDAAVASGHVRHKAPADLMATAQELHVHLARQAVPPPQRPAA